MEERRTPGRIAWLVIVVAAALWTTALIVSPVQAGRSTGSPALRLAASMTYLAAGHVCHQRPERSFRTAGVPWPVCGRCAAIYVAGLAGLLLAGVRPPAALPRGASLRRLLVVAALPTALSLVVEWTGLVDPGTLVRAVLALPLGAAVGWTLGTAVLARPAADGMLLH